MAKPTTVIKKSMGIGLKFETTGVLNIDESGIITIENDTEGVVEPHLALSVLDLDGQVVSIKVERKEEQEELYYEELV